MDNNPLQSVIKRKAAPVLSGVTKVMDAAYLAAFAFCVGWIFIKDSTMFSKIIPKETKTTIDGYYHLAAAILLVCAVLTLLLQDNIRLACFGAILIIVGYIQYAIGGHKFSYYVLCLMITGAAGKSFRKILTVWIAVNGLVMAAAVIASQAGIIEDLVYSGWRHSYGIVYCTDCAAHILFLMMAYAMLRLPRFRIWDYGVLLLGIFFMLGTGGRTNMLGGCLLTAGIFLGRLMKRKGPLWLGSKNGFRRLAGACGFLMCLSFPLIAVLSFAAPLALGRTISAPEEGPRMGRSMMKRLQIGYRGLQEHPFSFFGNQIKEHSLGGKTTHPDGWWANEYFFIDNSYLRLYMIGGAVIFCLLLAVLIYAQVRCFGEKKYLLEYFMLILAFVCFFEHHMVDFVFQILPLLAFSNVDIMGRKQRRRVAPASQEG